MQSALGVFYCHMWPVWLSRIYPHVVNGRIFELKKIIAHKMCVFWFLHIFETFLIPRIQQDSNHIMHTRLHVKWLVFLSDFNETWISSTHFRKILSSIKFHENPSNRSRVVPCGQTKYKHDEANFLENSWVPRPLSLGIQRPLCELWG